MQPRTYFQRYASCQSYFKTFPKMADADSYCAKKSHFHEQSNFYIISFLTTISMQNLSKVCSDVWFLPVYHLIDISCHRITRQISYFIYNVTRGLCVCQYSRSPHRPVIRICQILLAKYKTRMYNRWEIAICPNLSQYNRHMELQIEIFLISILFKSQDRFQIT